MPTIVSGSISILSDAGLGMAMFSLGNFLFIYFSMELINFKALIINCNMINNLKKKLQVYSWLYNQS